MKSLLVSAIIVLLSQSSYAQMGGFNLPGGGRNIGGLGGATGNNAASGMPAQGGQLNTGGFGTGFNFDPRFGATAIGNPFGGTAGGFGGNRMGNLGMGGMGMGGMGMGGLGMGMGMGMGMGGFGMGRMGGMGGMGGMGMQQQQQNKLRPTVRLGFEVDRPTTSARSQQVQLTLSRLPQAERFSGANIVMDGSRALVTGSVANPADAGLLRQLLLLEPGVYEVDTSQLNAAGGNQRPENVESAPVLGPSDSLVPPPRN